MVDVVGSKQFVGSAKILVVPDLLGVAGCDGYVVGHCDSPLLAIGRIASRFADGHYRRRYARVGGGVHWPAEDVRSRSCLDAGLRVSHTSRAPQKCHVVPPKLLQ